MRWNSLLQGIFLCVFIITIHALLLENLDEWADTDMLAEQIDVSSDFF